MLRVLAVDDEVPALTELAYLLRGDPRIGQVFTASEPTAALRELSRSRPAPAAGPAAGGGVDAPDGASFDAVFLDVSMPGLDGLELARVVRGLPDPPALVFVTAHDDFAVAAFDLRAVDYLLKPLSAGRLAEAVDRIVETRRPDQAEDPGTVPVELGGRVRFVDRATIRYVEAQGDYVRLHTESGGYLVRASLGTLERRWEAAGFVRIHRSTLVNTRHVAELRLEGGRAAVKVGEELLPVSRRQTREVRDQLVRRLQPRSGP